MIVSHRVDELDPEVHLLRSSHLPNAEADLSTSDLNDWVLATFHGQRIVSRDHRYRTRVFALTQDEIDALDADLLAELNVLRRVHGCPFGMHARTTSRGGWKSTSSQTPH